METYTRRRSRDLAGGDIILEIDSVRNGLFLYHPLHAAMGDNVVAFLMVRATCIMCT